MLKCKKKNCLQFMLIQANVDYFVNLEIAIRNFATGGHCCTNCNNDYWERP